MKRKSGLMGTAKFLRYQNSQGKVIPLHHAFKTIELSSVSRMSAIVLPIFFLSLIWLFLPFIFDLWGEMFKFWMKQIYNGQVGFEPENILGQRIYAPYPVLDAHLPSKTLVWWNLIVCFFLLLASYPIPRRALPLTYFLRAIMLIQASASINGLVSPDTFPYTLKIYMLDAITLSLYMLFLLPALLGLVYYIFDFSIGRKCWLTFMMFVYFLLFIPCQYMLHAYIIHEYSLLFMPLMYIFFGVLPDVLTFVSIYAYGMSWRSEITAIQGRGV